MPCLDVFLQQDKSYQESVLPSSVRARVAVEAGVTDCWYRFTGLGGKVIGIDRFGESAPGDILMAYFGFTAEAVFDAVAGLIAGH